MPTPDGRPVFPVARKGKPTAGGAERAAHRGGRRVAFLRKASAKKPERFKIADQQGYA